MSKITNAQSRRGGPPRAPDSLRDGSYVISMPPDDLIDIPIVVPRASTLSDEELARITIRGALPSSYGSISMCAHLQSRILFCKYKLGLTPSESEKRSIERTLRRLNRDFTRTASTEGFLLVDRRISPSSSPPPVRDREPVSIEENGGTSLSEADDTIDGQPTSVGDKVVTVLFRFPLYILFIFFIAIYDVVVDERFRRQVKRTVSFK